MPVVRAVGRVTVPLGAVISTWAPSSSLASLLRTESDHSPSLLTSE